ncbi:MAG: hypothetical protein RMK91_10380 [Pseudanabaenaceae cyanobacterium SKYGB_i_bin29]|nr:hypothetical protein [Pseudanabaenaceae cyanobacterium SKYG29]MDW8422258.1 hypothetical protein [Pseudanabaenaceae cyanobacterium SKYGB_i_bin29]
MTTPTTPDEILTQILKRAATQTNSVITNDEIRKRIENACREPSNRACARFLMACLLAKVHQPHVDPRKPYTEINAPDAFSGRVYDEEYIANFIRQNRLPLNSTTAFLTPAFRTINQPLTKNIDLVGNPRKLYRETLELLDDVCQNRVTAEEVLTEVIRVLLLMRFENQNRISDLLSRRTYKDNLPLSSEEIVDLIEQHLKCRNSSRLPVLIVAAAYNSVGEKLGERLLPLQKHNAADTQTGSLGDLEVSLTNEDSVVTIYEMKMKRVTLGDIDKAVEKIASSSTRIHNYIFITTEVISKEVKSQAKGCYEQTGGTEVAVLDCIGFLRHFLHFFHRSRAKFLDAYQELVLSEPDSAVNQSLKEAFLILRQVAESDRE